MAQVVAVRRAGRRSAICGPRATTEGKSGRLSCELLRLPAAIPQPVPANGFLELQDTLGLPAKPGSPQVAVSKAASLPTHASDTALGLIGT
jgi:hypothetical protein